MKRPAEVQRMIDRVERAVEPGESRGALIMALEWVLGGGVSTGVGLETWLDEEDTPRMPAIADTSAVDGDDCTCSDRSWYGQNHDSTCPLRGKREVAE